MKYRTDVSWLAGLGLGLCLAGGVAGCNTIFDRPSCSADGRLYTPGETFYQGTQTCTCDEAGRARCVVVEPPMLCELDTTYTYGTDGGNAAARDSARLEPPLTYVLTRSSSRGTQSPSTSTCSPALPACGVSTGIDVFRIMTDIRAQGVQAALDLSVPPFFGHDQRPVDGPAYGVQRADGHGFLVGAPCTIDAPSTVVKCLPIPDDVQRLVDDLRALDQQQLMDPACASLGQP